MVLNKNEFREWLENNRDKAVGVVGAKGQCPISCFINSKNPGADALVYGNGFYFKENGEYVFEYNPYWVQEFVWSLDSMRNVKVVNDWKDSGFVSGEACLSVLDNPSILVGPLEDVNGTYVQK